MRELTAADVFRRVRIEWPGHETHNMHGTIEQHAHGPFWIVRLEDGSRRSFSSNELRTGTYVATWKEDP